MTSQDRRTSFHELIHRYRTRLGMTQRQLADLSTVSVRGIRDLERGRATRPRRETVRLLADALRLDGRRRAALEVAAIGHERSMDVLTWCAPSPTPLNRLVGRESEAKALGQLLTMHGQRLVTVVGLSGVGKTRLVLDVATALHTESRWPVVWVSRPGLGDAMSPSSVAASVNRALDGEEIADDLTEAVGDRRTLLVIDGHDGITHLLNEVLVDLLRRCPGLCIVVTSLGPLRAPGEQVFALASLAVPDEDDDQDPRVLKRYASTLLMTSHLRRVHLDPAVNVGLAPTVAAICRQLDGVPRALEYAAGWCLLHTPQALLDQLRSGTFILAPPPTVANGGSDVHNAIARSLVLLNEEEHGMLADLAELDGCWSLTEAARRIQQSDAGLASAAHVILSCGLIRSRGGQQNRFEVLNLVRRLLDV